MSQCTLQSQSESRSLRSRGLLCVCCRGRTPGEVPAHLCLHRVHSPGDRGAGKNLGPMPKQAAPFHPGRTRAQQAEMGPQSHGTHLRATLPSWDEPGSRAPLSPTPLLACSVTCCSQTRHLVQLSQMLVRSTGPRGPVSVPLCHLPVWVPAKVREPL